MCAKIKQKRLIISLLFYIFEKAMLFLSSNDTVFARDLNNLPDGFSFSFSIKYSNLSVSFIKENDVLKKSGDRKDFRLKLVFNNLCSAFLVFSGILPQHTAFAEHRIAIYGSIADALVLTSVMNRLQSVIFPDFVSKRLIKEFKPSSDKEKALFLKFYLYGWIF